MRRWLFLLALALLASSAHALPDGLPTGTYYEPGTYRREMTDVDRLAMYIHQGERQLPRPTPPMPQ